MTRHHWGNSFIVLTSGRKIYLETPYEELKEEWKAGKQEIWITFATWYGIGGMVVSARDIVEIGKPEYADV